METKKKLTFNLKFEKVDEVLKDVEGMQEEVEVYIQLTSDNIKELLGAYINDDKVKELLKKIGELSWDAIIDNPKIQAPPITRPTMKG